MVEEWKKQGTYFIFTNIFTIIFNIIFLNMKRYLECGRGANCVQMPLTSTQETPDQNSQFKLTVNFMFKLHAPGENLPCGALRGGMCIKGRNRNGACPYRQGLEKRCRKELEDLEGPEKWVVVKETGFSAHVQKAVVDG